MLRSVQVCEELRFASQTSWLAVHYFDRYLSKSVKTPHHLIELIALTCLHMAAKYLETASPTLDNLSTRAQQRFSTRDFMYMEIEILQRLDWTLGLPSPHTIVMHLVNIFSDRDVEVSRRASVILRRAGLFVELSSFGRSRPIQYAHGWHASTAPQ